MIDWNYDMDLAPKDGTRVLLAVKGSAPGDLINGPSAHSGMWVDGGIGIGFCWQPSKWGSFMFTNVYAWAPLPVPPLPVPDNVIHLSVTQTDRSDIQFRKKYHE